MFDFLSMLILMLLYKNFCYKYNFLSYSKYYKGKTYNADVLINFNNQYLKY